MNRIFKEQDLPIVRLMFPFYHSMVKISSPCHYSNKNISCLFLAIGVSIPHFRVLLISSVLLRCSFIDLFPTCLGWAENSVNGKAMIYDPWTRPTPLFETTTASSAICLRLRFFFLVLISKPFLCLINQCEQWRNESESLSRKRHTQYRNG